MSAIISGLIGGAVAAVLASWAERGRRKARKDSQGWRSLRPGWLLHGTFVGCFALVAFISFFLLNGGSARSDADTQNLYALGLLIAFALGAVYVAWITYGRTVAWLGGKIKTTDVFGRERFYRLCDIDQINETLSGSDYVIRFTDGSRLKFSKYMHGVPEFLKHLPPSKF